MPVAAVAARRWACPPRLPGRSALSPLRPHLARCLASDAAPPKPHYVTTPIFYVNAAPHIGHLHSIVLADVASRWAAWRGGPGSRALLATGTDEHGLKIQRAASANGEDAAALCARVSGTFRVSETGRRA
jgi:methionyl-tRNA synthetase